ncbi:MAG: NAD-dependent protein deacylase [Proteobacteria bacterium]|nr:NAD-dependent protein deacylase [Pseudomonadota bacterium]
MNRWDDEIGKAASILSKATRATAFCGAGGSEESGISTFRDPGGIWDQFDPSEFGTSEGLIRALERDSQKLLPMFTGLLDTFEQAEANPGHKALAVLEGMGILKAVITQNVDNLQQEAGSNNVIEVHGNLFRMICMFCNSSRKIERKAFIWELKEKLDSLKDISLSSLVDIAPKCDGCGHIMRPDVVMFGEAVQKLPHAFATSRNTDVMLVLGTSGVVYPAAYFPIEAKKAGADIVVVNPTENAFTQVTDIYIPLKTGEALPAIVERINEMAG